MGFLSGFDQALLRLVRDLPAGLQPLMVFVTTFGSPVFCAITVACIAFWAWIHKDRSLAFLHLIVFIMLPLGGILKQLIRRDRPDTTYVQNMLIHSYSFPSEHAYVSFLVYGLFAYLIFRRVTSSWKWSVIAGLVAMIIFVGISRVYLGAHYPSDVIGGWLLGGIVLYVVVNFHHRRSPRAPGKKVGRH